MADVDLWIVSLTELEKAGILGFERVESPGKRGLGDFGIRAQQNRSRDLAIRSASCGRSGGTVTLVEIRQSLHHALEGDAIHRVLFCQRL